MNTFTVKLNDDESIEVVADIAKDEDGVLSFYNEEATLNNNGGNHIPISSSMITKEKLVGKFDQFEYFYIAKGV